MIKNLSFGSDPEYFVINEATKMIVSGIPIIIGSKETPESLGDGYFVQKDNVLAEGNIPPVFHKGDFVATRDQFIYNMEELKRRITEYIKGKYPTLGLFHSDCQELNSAFLSHPEAMQFGCSPYLNAWDDESHVANDLSIENFRTAGFHVHVGFDVHESTIWSRETISSMIARAYDLFVVIPSCLVQVDLRRFENYGGLGQYRDTSYGLECRSLGAYFVKEKYLPWVFDQTVKAIQFATEEENVHKLMYMAMPNISLKDGVSFDTELYTALGISFEDQLIKTKSIIHA